MTRQNRLARGRAFRGGSRPPFARIQHLARHTLWTAGSIGLLSLAGPGCERLKAPPRWQEGRCDPDHPCAGGEVCVPERPGGLRGYCLRECGKDKPCPKGARCTGRYQRVGTADTFCRAAQGDVGADCRDPRRGCKPGARCFGGTCVRECTRDPDCPEAHTRCLPVVVNTVVEKDRTRWFSACLPATRPEGASCKPAGPFCARGLVCGDGRCVRQCRSDQDCGKGQRCDGRLYLGPGRAERAKRNAPPDVRYCRKAARRGASCHPTLDVSCAPGLACIRFRCRRVRHGGEGARCDPAAGRLCAEGLLCAAGRCRRPCLQDADCAARTGDADADAPGRARARRRARKRRRASRRRKRRAKALRCQEATVSGQPVKVCM